MIDLLERLRVALADRYQLQRELGAGGMATVYLAQDLRHDRQVAVKVLKPELAAVIGAERFLHEIRVTAHLQHPHILPLFDSGEADSFLFYVMPYIEGESLRDRLTREKQLPVEDAVDIAKAVASALDYAHRHKVIHRDIKPENILLHDGQPVVADFGIALAVSVAGGTRITETGLSLGTPHYMSPEQATADRELDARSDLYSLGCVIYEMLSGEPPHTGPTVQSIIAKVLTDEPRRVRLMRSTVPPHVEEAIHKALAKLPADRFATVQQFADALTRSAAAAPISTEPSLVVRIPRPVAAVAAWVGRNQLASLLGIGLLIAIGVMVWALLRPMPQPPLAPVARFTLRLPQGAPLGGAAGTTIAVSPDGSRIVYVASTTGGLQLYMRGLDQLDPVPIPGTNGGTQPFFSPDGEWLAFEQAGKLVKVALAGGPVLPVSDVPRGLLGASWGPGDTIVFATGTALMSVVAAGGEPRLLVAADSASGEVLRWPEFLPDGRGVLFTVRVAATDRLALFATRGGDVKRFDQAGSNPHYVTGGYVLLANLSGTLVTVPFDTKRLEVAGSAIPVAEGVEVGSGGAAKLGASRNGAVAYSAGVTDVSRLMLVGRRGAARDLGAEPQTYDHPRLSPDGRRIAVTVMQGGALDVWIYDITQRTRTRLTFDQHGEWPVWTPDGRRIVYTRRTQSHDLYWVPADGSASAESLLVAPGEQFSGDLTPDGRVLIYESANALWFLRLDSASGPRPFLATSFNNHSPSLAPEGRWVAYVSDESGRSEVYVRPFPGPGGRWQVSLDGGTEPRWSPTGREIFYRNGNRMMAAAVRTQPEFAVGDRVELFEGTYVTGPRGGAYPQYDVMRDGQSFVMVKPESESQDVVVVLNWFAQLRAGTGRSARASSASR